MIGFSKCGDLPNIYNAKFNYMSLKSTSCHTIYVNNDALVAQSERVSLMWEGVLGIALRLSKWLPNFDVGHKGLEFTQKYLRRDELNPRGKNLN